MTPEEKTWLKAHPDITLGTSASYPPHIITKPDGTYTGVLPDVYEQISQLLKTKVNVHVGKVWSHVQKQAENRELDGLAIGGRDPNRDKFYTATDPLYPSYFSVFAPSLHDLQINSFKDLDGLRIGYKRGARPAKTRLETLPSAIIVSFDSHESMTQALLSKEIDVIVAWMSYDHWRKKTLQGTIDKIYLIKESPFDMVIYIRNDWPEFVSIMNKALAVLQQNQLPLIINKWFGQWPQAKAPSVVFTPEEQFWLAEHPNIVLGAPTDYPPMVLKRVDGTHVGVLVDFFEKINQHLDYKVQLHIGDSWAEVQEKGQNREIDGLAFGGRDPNRDAIYNATDIVLPTYFSVFARSKNDFQIRSFSDLDGLRIGYKRAARPTRTLLEKLPSAILKSYVSHESMTQALLKKEIDVIVAWMSYDHWRKERLQGTIDNILLINEYPIEMVTYIRKDWPELISIFNKVIGEVQKDELPRIINKWFGEWPEHPKAPSINLTPKEKAWLDQKHTVQIRIIDYPPYIILNEEKPPVGIVIEYLKLIEERSGVTFKYDVTNQPFVEFLENIKLRRAVDMTPIIVPTPERERYISFTIPYLSSPYVIFLREDGETILDISGLYGKKVAVPRGHVVQNKLESNYPKIRLKLFDSDEKALQALATGQADAYIGNLTLASHIIQRRGFSGLRVTATTPFGEQAFSIGNRKDWPELTSIINKALQSITEEEKTAIRNKFLAINYAQGIDKTKVLHWILIILGSSVGIFLLVLLWNRQLSREISIRKQTENELMKAKDNAEAANQAKSVFLASMSHELRTPLNAILGFSEILTQGSDTTADQKEKLTMINRSGAHLLSMINEVLDLSRIEAGRIEILEENFNLPLMLEDIGKMFELRARNSGLDFELSIDEELVRYIRADSMKMRQILNNLLSNAVKFTEQGNIILRARSMPIPDDQANVIVQLEIEDSGIGIIPEEVENIFKPFYQPKNSPINAKGAGLGLAITKSFVEIMDGIISVESTPPKGTKFRIELPVSRVEDSELVAAKTARPEVKGLEPDQPALRILIVEDNLENRLLLRSHLRQVGFEIREAENGKEAIAHFEEWHPHFIWMDIRMPVMDGYKATRKIRSLPGGESVKIVALTASVFQELRQDILDAGCDDVVHKPFNSHEIYETMARYLDIQYIYKEKEAEAPEEQTALLTSDMLANLPEELLQELRKTTLALDREATSKVISHIADHTPDVAKRLKELVDNFQMVELRKLLE